MTELQLDLYETHSKNLFTITNLKILIKQVLPYFFTFKGSTNRVTRIFLFLSVSQPQALLIVLMARKIIEGSIFIADTFVKFLFSSDFYFGQYQE